MPRGVIDGRSTEGTGVGDTIEAVFTGRGETEGGGDRKRRESHEYQDFP
jgi:hypothetical protein